ncbi:MAG: O-antigen ligase family protein [Actinobacteria bacterium]|nr:O-antigen ligase family protein [Actinomycetota bacterium]
MSQLWRVGVRGGVLSAIAAWKDVLLVCALALLVLARRRIPRPATAVDWLALAFGAIVVLYGVLPQSVLGGGATHKGIVYGARHDLLPVGAYFLGRGLDLTADERARICRTVLATAAFVALFGLVDVYALSLGWWRESHGWFHDQLGLDYRGLSRLPENFIYNQGNGVIFRRLTSTFLSPLATAYLLVVALFFLPLRARRWAPPLALLLFAALLWTHTRAALLALVVGLLALALLRRVVFPAGLAVAVAAIGLAFVSGYAHFGPRAHFTPAELRIQEANAHAHPGTSNDPTSANESSTSEHLASLRAGARTALHHPWGFGLGNAGVTAARTHVKVEAGESTYTELAVETGVLGGLLFIAWSLALLLRLRRVPWLAASFVALLFLALQTDVIGIPWIAVVVWAVAGDAAASYRGRKIRNVVPAPSTDSTVMRPL